MKLRDFWGKIAQRAERKAERQRAEREIASEHKENVREMEEVEMDFPELFI